MANYEISENLMFQWAQHPDMRTNTDLQGAFKDRFSGLSEKEKYQILTHMFSNYSEAGNQYFLMELADMMVKHETPSKFDSKQTWVDFFIKNYSFNKELEEMRNTIWKIMQ